MESKIKEMKIYTITLCCVLLVHVILTAMFAIAGVMLFTILNLISVAIYVTLIFMVRKGKYILSMASAYVEILLYAGYAMCVLPHECGFHLYTLGLVPVFFYDIYTVNGIKHRVRVAAATMGSALLVTLVCGYISNVKLFGAVEIPQTCVNALSLFNFMAIFVLVTLISMVYVLRINEKVSTLTEEKEALSELSSHDVLTGLYNRRIMEEKIKLALDNYRVKDEPFSVIMIDIDDFKAFNDNYGHEVGDLVLKSIADLLKECMKGFGEVARWGGEELLLMVRGNEFQSAFMAEAIRRKIESMQIESGGKQLSVTATFGVACCSGFMTCRELVNLADKKMYMGKNNGKNQVVK